MVTRWPDRDVPALVRRGDVVLLCASNAQDAPDRYATVARVWVHRALRDVVRIETADASGAVTYRVTDAARLLYAHEDGRRHHGAVGLIVERAG
jgi:hypothetical protein